MHRLTEKLLACHANTWDKTLLKEQLDKIDEVAKDCMLHSEKKCRKLRCGQIRFSPEAPLWIKYSHFYQALLRYKIGKGTNLGNLKQTAQHCSIQDALKLSIEEISAYLRECKQRLQYFKVHSQTYRTQHMNKCLEASIREKGDEEAESGFYKS